MLIGMKNGDAEAWKLFNDNYMPLLNSYLRRMHVSASDCEDLQQQVVLEALKKIPEHYEWRGPYTFRAWLGAIMRGVVVKYRIKQQKQRIDRVASQALDELVDGKEDLETAWDQEYKEYSLTRALAIARQEYMGTRWDAFDRTVINGQPIVQVARDLGVSQGHIYNARSLIYQRIREVIAELDPPGA